MDEQENLEIIIGSEKAIPDKFIEFGEDKEYFAVIGADVYQRITENNYQLIRKDVFDVKYKQ